MEFYFTITVPYLYPHAKLNRWRGWRKGTRGPQMHRANDWKPARWNVTQIIRAG